MTPKKQVSPVIRISQGERDASARATHLEAATRKFLVTTNERKQMSTTTNFKRIALVAVAALGLGVLSSVPAKAVVSNLSITVGTAGATELLTATTVSSDSTTGTTFTVTSLMSATSDSLSVTFVEKSLPTGATVDARMIYVDTATTTSTAEMNTSSTAITTSNKSFLDPADSQTAGGFMWLATATPNSYVNARFNISLESATATAKVGTYVYTVIAQAYAAGAATAVTATADVSIVVSSSTDLSTTPSATTSFVDLRSAGQSAGTADAADDVIDPKVATAGSTNHAFIFVGNRNAANGSSTANDSITATVTGAGVVCTTDAPGASPTVGTCGKSLTVAASTGDYMFVVRADGTAGTSTITVSSSVLGTSSVKSMTFYAKDPKTLTASVFTPILAIGANDSAVAVTAVDANGTNWAGTLYIYASAAADATAVGGSATAPKTCVYRSANATYYCPITATAAGTGKFKVTNGSTVALSTVTSNEVTVKSAVATPATIKLSFNKAAYAPNEVGLIVITPLDAAGNGLPATSITNALASGGISSDVGLTVTGCTLSTLTDVETSAYAGTTSVAGSKTCIFTAPAAGSKITLTAKGGTGLPLAGQVAITTSATITDNAAAALAAVTALSTTVASLRTLITTLTNLVLKIQKKVRA